MGVESTSSKPPTLDVWIIVLGETVTRENFELCSQAVDKSCVPKQSYLKGETAWRYIVACLLPQFAMRHRHIPRSHWSFSKTKVMEGTGKAYLSLKYDPENRDNHRPAMGFSWAETGAAMAFAHSLGQKDVVINIGVGIHSTLPTVSPSAYIQSHLHQLTRREEQSLCIERYGESRAVHRLNIILSTKDAYLRAMGQPIGFDLSRINCDVAKGVVSVDGSTLDGWEFHIFTANVDSHRKIPIAKHLLQYLVVVAVFRGDHETKFIFTQERDMGFVKFLDVSQIIRDVPRLGDYDHAPMPPIEQIPLSNKSSVQTLTPHSAAKHRSSDVKHSSDIKHIPDAKHPPPSDKKYLPDVKHIYDPKASSDTKPALDSKSDHLLLNSAVQIPSQTRPYHPPMSKQVSSHAKPPRTVPIYTDDYSNSR